jgi:hypothetical protein
MTPSPTNQTNPPIILITGNMASGKSTIALVAKLAIPIELWLMLSIMFSALKHPVLAIGSIHPI